MASTRSTRKERFKGNCSFDQPERICDYDCFACTFMHGLTEGGSGGLWGTTGVPKRYKGSRKDNLPIQDANPDTYEDVTRFMENTLFNVQEKNIGLYLFSKGDKDNPFGTGTGKTTTATAILNEYVIARAKEYLTGRQDMERNPAVFVKATELQNAFNSMFRGTKQQQEQASIKYYRLKEKIKKYELVVLDDIATRGSRISEAWEDELYEIIDYRSSTRLGATFFTANVPIEHLSKIIGERITSRIKGMAVPLHFGGVDKRTPSF